MQFHKLLKKIAPKGLTSNAGKIIWVRDGYIGITGLQNIAISSNLYLPETGHNATVMSFSANGEVTAVLNQQTTAVKESQMALNTPEGNVTRCGGFLWGGYHVAVK